LIYITQIDSFYYNKDSTVIRTEFLGAGRDETITYYNADSSVIQYEHILSKGNYPIKISCDKKLSKNRQCSMTYRGIEVKTFPIDKFELRAEFLTLDFLRQMKMIDEAKK
jgi:hypothetical protein